MAIDTKAKRASVQAYTMGLMRPPPDGTVSEGDRATVAWFYLGMDYNNPAVGGGGVALYGMPWFLYWYNWFFGG